MSEIEARLSALGISLPEAGAPLANYVPFVREGNLLHVSGQLPLENGALIKGVVGVDLDVEAARYAARVCGVNLIAQIKKACEGDLGRVARIIKLGGFVQAGPDFVEIPAVINGCSDLMVEVFADAGKHARSAVGVYRLPLGVAVEVDAVVALS